MEEKVFLYDSNNKKIGKTYIRRARQLVKQQRAFWVDNTQKAIRFVAEMESLEEAVIIEEDAPVYIYRSEIMETVVKWFNDSASQIEDLPRFDNLINSRAEDGWELVTHSYMVNVWGARSSLLLTFRKQKNMQ